jgi:hypothetical protein
MNKTAMIVLAPIVFLAVFSRTGNGQDIYKYEIFGGVSFADLANSRIGWNFLAAGNITRNLGIAVDISRTNYRDIQYVVFADLVSQRNLFLAGIQLAERDSGSPTYYLQFMAGMDHSRYRWDPYGEKNLIEHLSVLRSNSLALSMGGGVDYQLKGPFAFRLHANLILLKPLGVWTLRGKVSGGLVYFLSNNESWR